MTLRNEQRGAAERLLDLVLSSGAHLWHNRPGLEREGRWLPATAANRHRGGRSVRPGLFVPAAADLYGRLLDIYLLDAELAARFASYALTRTEWRDLQVCCAALMLVQPRCGAPVRDSPRPGEVGPGPVVFYDDDYRAVGEAMLLRYAPGSPHMLTPKAVLRVAQLLEVPQIAELNRIAGFAGPAAAWPPLGRWRSAARQWLAVRERNAPMLDGLVAAGYKETIKALARKCGYRPHSPRFFEVLGWPQRQAAGGHRRVGLSGLSVARRERFDGLSEVEICERIVTGKLSYKDAVGRLPAGMGLTPAIMVALLPSLSDRDLRILTPTLEGLGLLADAQVRARWERALSTATDQRSLNIARNVRGEAVREALAGAAETAVATAVAEAVPDKQLQVMFLIDKSGSMEGAIEASKEALVRILAGFPADRLHIATFDTTGRVLRPKATSRVGITHLLDPVRAGGGTTHAAAVRAMRSAGVRIPDGHRLVVIVVGDEAGERGAQLARCFNDCGYFPAAFAMIVNVTDPRYRGSTVRDTAAALEVPFSEVDVSQFDDPYQVTRVLTTLLDAPVPTTGGRVGGWLAAVLETPLLAKP